MTQTAMILHLCHFLDSAARLAFAPIIWIKP